jgi:hypothetical protein
LTSMVSRDEVLDALYRIGGPYKTREIQRAMLTVERYAYTVADRIVKNDSLIEIAPGNHHNLAPGEADPNANVRRCLRCGKIRKLSKYYPRRKGSPCGRNTVCVICTRPSGWTSGRKTADQFLCQRCKQWKVITAFPERKQKDPRLTMKCSDCKLPGSSG